MLPLSLQLGLPVLQLELQLLQLSGQASSRSVLQPKLLSQAQSLLLRCCRLHTHIAAW